MIKLLTKKEKNKQIFYNTKEGKMQNFLSEDCLFLDDKEKIYKRKMSPEQRRNINTVTFSRKYIITNKELTVFIDQYNKTESNINATCLWKNSSKCENVRENSSLKKLKNLIVKEVFVGKVNQKLIVAIKESNKKTRIIENPYLNKNISSLKDEFEDDLIDKSKEEDLINSEGSESPKTFSFDEEKLSELELIKKVTKDYHITIENPYNKDKQDRPIFVNELKEIRSYFDKKEKIKTVYEKCLKHCNDREIDLVHQIEFLEKEKIEEMKDGQIDEEFESKIKGILSECYENRQIRREIKDRLFETNSMLKEYSVIVKILDNAITEIESHYDRHYHIRSNGSKNSIMQEFLEIEKN